MKKLYYAETHSVNPYYNLAFEEYLLKRFSGGDIFMLWQNAPTVVLGRNQCAEDEVRLEFAEQNRIFIARRATGGGAVFHDLGNLNYSFVTDNEDGKAATLERLSAPIISALQSIGIDAQIGGRNDLSVDGKKFSGTAQRIENGRILHHGTLLFDCNTDLLAEVLNVNREKLRSKGVSSVQSRVTNLKDYCPDGYSINQLWVLLKDFIASDAESLSLNDAQLAEVLATEGFYSSHDWIFRRQPRYPNRKSKRFSGGTVEATYRLQNSVLTDIGFSGDFLSLLPLDRVCSLLRGIEFSKGSVENALSTLCISNYFGSITLSELLSLLFD